MTDKDYGYQSFSQASVRMDEAPFGSQARIMGGLYRKVETETGWRWEAV